MSEPEDESTPADAVTPAEPSGPAPTDGDMPPAPPPTPPVAPASPPAPMPEVAPAVVTPASVAPAAAATQAAAPAITRDEDAQDGDAKAGGDLDDDYDDDWDETAARDLRASRWVAMVTALGIGIVTVVGLQVLMSLIEGMSLDPGERIFSPETPQVTDDLLHRLGYPFLGLGATSQLLLVLGVVLISLPPVLGGRVSTGQDRAARIALWAVTVLAVVVAIGSLLGVRASLHEYTVKNAAVPSFVRVGFTNLLLGTLTGAALAVFGSITARSLRHRER